MQASWLGHPGYRGLSDMEQVLSKLGVMSLVGVSL